MPSRLSFHGEMFLPVVHFFNAIPDSDFVACIADLLQGRGRGYHSTLCSFRAYDEDEEPFEGVKFYNGVTDDEVIVSHTQFADFIKEAALSYLQREPHQRGLLIALFNESKCQLS